MDATAHPLILVIEDEPAIANLICDILEDYGYYCVTAGGADDALQLLESLSPALITLDLGLPGVSGRTLLQLLRADGRTRNTPVVIISAERVIDASVRAASQALLAKPFDVDRLIDIVEQTLQAAPADGQAYNLEGESAWRWPPRSGAHSQPHQRAVGGSDSLGATD